MLIISFTLSLVNEKNLSPVRINCPFIINSVVKYYIDILNPKAKNRRMLR
jgi:hypothetical protein